MLRRGYPLFTFFDWPCCRVCTRGRQSTFYIDSFSLGHGKTRRTARRCRKIVGCWKLTADIAEQARQLDTEESLAVGNTGLNSPSASIAFAPFTNRISRQGLKIMSLFRRLAVWTDRNNFENVLSVNQRQRIDPLRLRGFESQCGSVQRSARRIDVVDQQNVSAANGITHLRIEQIRIFFRA